MAHPLSIINAHSILHVKAFVKTQSIGRGSKNSVEPKSSSPRREATFPVGEGDLRRGMRGGTDFVLHTVPHPSGLRPATLSQERVFPLPIRQKSKNLPPGKRRQVITLGSPKRGSLSRSLPSIACGKGLTLRARSTNRGLPCPGDPGHREGSCQRRSGFTEA